MNQTIPTRPKAVGHWIFLAFWIGSLVLSQLARVMFTEFVVFNPGLAFGVSISNQLIIPTVILFLVLVFVWYLKKSHKNIYEVAAFGMILGGGTSNLIERFIFDSQVADYWNIMNISTINLADVFIGLGIIIMLMTLFRYDK